MTAANASPPALEAFFGTPEIGQVALSPSGKTLALTAPGKDGRMELVAADLGSQPWNFKTLAWLKAWDVAWPTWLNEGRLVFQALDRQSGDLGGATGLWAVDADGQNGRLLIDGEYAGYRLVMPGSHQVLSAEWLLHSLPSDGGDDVFVVRRQWSARGVDTQPTLARIDTRAPALRLLSRDAPDDVVRWVVGADGRPAFAETVARGRRQVWRKQEEGWRRIADFKYPGFEGWTPRFMLDGELFISVETPAKAGAQLRLWDATTGRPAESTILSGTGFDVGANARPLFARPGGALIGWRYALDTVYTHWGDPAMVRGQAAIDAALPGRVNVIHCERCLDGERWLVQSLSDREPPSWYVLERSTGKLSRVGSARPALVGAATGRRSFHRISARDGRDLPVYLTRPLQGDDKPRPAVLYIHGGPASRTSLDWTDGIAQFLASRGYVVVEPDFRGSVGYGWAHETAGDRQWGLAMQDDMQDALRWAVKQGHVDASRVCIMGASFGGYSALMGPVRYPDAFRCAVAWVAPTDLPEMVSTDLDAISSATGQEIYRTSIGTPESVAEASPLKHVREIRVPVLAAFGTDDRRVPILHGRRLRDAARAAKVDLEYVEYEDEGHNWQNPRTRIDFFSRVERLLARALDD